MPDEEQARTAYVPVAGTWGGQNELDWWRAGSSFDRYVSSRGFTREAAAFRFWSTALSGTFFCGNGHLAWQFGAHRLREFLQGLTSFDQRNVIAHSHGGQWSRTPPQGTLDRTHSFAR